MLILKTTHKEAVLTKFNMLVKIVKSVQSEDQFKNMVEQYHLYINLICTQLNRLGEKEKASNLGFAYGQLRNQYLGEKQ